jgi:internalin A
MRLRYSFKLMLIAFSVVAVCIGLFAVRLHVARRQREAVAALRAADVSVWYSYETSSGRPAMNVPDPLADTPGRGYSDVSKWKVWLGRQFGRDFAFDVGHVYRGTPLSADLVARLPQLRGLEHLQLSIGKGFDDAAWQALQQCRQIDQLTLEREHFEPVRRLKGLAALDQLQGLTIENGDLTIEDAREIADLSHLQELSLGLVGLTNDALLPLAKLKNLELLHLKHRGHGKEVTAAGIAFISQMPKLRSLELARIPSLNDDVFSQLEAVTSLESLNFDQAEITGAEIHRLSRLPKLKTLNLIGTKVDDIAMQKLAEFKQLEVLDISFTNVTDAGFTHVAALSNLRSLTVSGDTITDDGLAEILRLTQLEELIIGRTNATDDGLKHLAKLPKLRALRLNENPKITKAGVAAFKAALPECNVY